VVAGNPSVRWQGGTNSARPPASVALSALNDNEKMLVAHLQYW